ncbi:MAG: hypothetical protein LBV72_20125 [Tannerella sp.]|jgi:hypothetical protein|nr:hypothetical protein [Tannerella sp.]
MKSIYFIISVAVLFLWNMPATAQKMESKERQMDLRDPHAYNTAAEMLMCADTLPYTEAIDIILDLISDNINAGMLIEDEQIWKLLKKLEPYRMTEQVQMAVNVWIDKTLENIAEKQKDKMVPAKHMQSMSIAYKEKDFEKAVNIACDLLLDIPNTLDTRNNLALALMHLNYDLCAQIELEIIRRMSDQYAPGLINLTVLNERMNRSDYARGLSRELLLSSREESSDVQLARFNAAWYLNEEGDYKEADLVLNKIKEPAYNKIKKYTDLKAANKKQLKEVGKVK